MVTASVGRKESGSYRNLRNQIASRSVFGGGSLPRRRLRWDDLSWNLRFSKVGNGGVVVAADPHGAVVDDGRPSRSGAVHQVGNRWIVVKSPRGGHRLREDRHIAWKRRRDRFRGGGAMVGIFRPPVEELRPHIVYGARSDLSHQTLRCGTRGAHARLERSFQIEEEHRVDRRRSSGGASER